MGGTMISPFFLYPLLPTQQLEGRPRQRTRRGAQVMPARR